MNWGVVKTSCVFTVIIYSICAYTFVCRYWTENYTKWKWRKKIGGHMKGSSRHLWEGISASGLRREEGCFRCLKQTLTYSVKNIYNLTYIFIFRLKHESFIQVKAVPPHKHFTLVSFRTVDTLVRLSFRGVTGPVYTCHFLHMRLGSGSVLAANESVLLNAYSCFCFNGIEA